jgi:hypothetical protein
MFSLLQASKTMLLAAVLLQVQTVYGLLPCSEIDLYCFLVVFAVGLRLFTAALTEVSFFFLNRYFCINS